MSSSTLVLVNHVLSLTGGGKQLTTIIDSPGGIADRIVRFLNIVSDQINAKPVSWIQLRVNATGTGNGTDDIFEFSGAEDVPPSSVVSVWLPAYGRLSEVTARQFDDTVADPSITYTQPTIFQRGATTAGVAQIQIYGVPGNGDVINMSAYKKPTRLTNDASTTEFDDDILTLGALMHMDAYDGLDRGYASLFSDRLDLMVLEEMRNMEIITVPVDYR